ncbi:hypothetical protein OGATHE_002633 [Ogataea polymorpha]|uniref:Uncharacterized protein n=1 Tax=Ogataea polymorpha TaxID=460523 RepID=A0A9P8PDI2_9ASCO|nr:hypothetical protein OGATHE_002633 [Ogataea polymorpha]
MFKALDGDSFLTLGLLCVAFELVFRFFRGTSSDSSSLNDVVGVFTFSDPAANPSSDSDRANSGLLVTRLRFTAFKGVSSSDEDIPNPNNFFLA